MAHYAKVRDEIVQDVIVAEAEFFDTFVDSSPGDWIQCSYNTRGNVHYGNDGLPDGGIAIRGNYPSVGYTYNTLKDVFIPPKKFNSWILNEETFLYEAPVPYPTDGAVYIWDEETLTWITFAP